MTLQIVDRRQASKNNSIGNRERFLRRYKEKIRESVREAVSGRGIRDIEQSANISIPKKDISEPVFRQGPGGIRESVHPGNEDYVRGDHIKRPSGGGAGGGKGKASDSGEGEDDFVFTLSKEEFMQVFFEDLALPHLVRSKIGETPDWKTRRAGFTRDGTPNNLSVVRSMRGALGRRLALGAGTRRTLEQAHTDLAALEKDSSTPEPVLSALRLRIAEMEARLRAIPFLDPLDLRFRGRVKVPVPTSKAVMFCLMDVSGSMDEARKDLAKRFFILLYLFLTRHYEKIDIVFIRHHTQAQEVNEHDFFHATESGGTVVSSALELMHHIQQQRYDPAEWNIYGAQASDGDNYESDSGRCAELLMQSILPQCRYFAYVQVVEDEQSLWAQYAQVAQECAHFAIRKATQASEIYPVFRDLFKKEGEAA